VFNELNAGTKIQIKDISGKNVYDRKIDKKTTEIDLSKYSKGVYFIELIMKDKTYSSKIILK